MSHPSQALDPVARVAALVANFKPSGNGGMARCPAHDDRHASLSIGTGDDGRALLSCKTGCSTQDVVAAIGLTMADLFNPSERRFRVVSGDGHAYHHVRRDGPSGKRMWWVGPNGRAGLNGSKLEDLPLYGVSCLDDLPADTTVYVTEGEAAAQALIDAGAYAVGTVTGAAGTPSGSALEILARFRVVLWPDNDDPGRKHMDRIAARLNMSRPPDWLEWRDAPAKGDAVDYLRAGGKAAGLDAHIRPWRATPETSTPAPNVIRIVNAVDLLNAEFKPPRWAVQNLLMEGLSLLAGRPKLGKSWLALGLGVDVASGSAAFGKIQTEAGEVLYMALEDGERRMQERLQLVLGERPPPPLLYFAYDWPKFDVSEGGLTLLAEWMEQHPLARLIVIDTFKRVRASEAGANGKRLYDLDYDALAPLAALARLHGIAVIVVFHARKGEAEDPLDLVSGTTGLSGACDSVMVLRRERGQADASLFVTGRDIEERDMALRWHGDTSQRFWWEWIGEAEDYRLSAERRAIMDVVAEMPGCKPADISGALNKTVGSIRYLLFKMVRDGQVRQRSGAYYPAEPLSPPTNANAPTTAIPPTPSSVSGYRGHSTCSVCSENSDVCGCEGKTQPPADGRAAPCPDCGRMTAGPWARYCDACRDKRRAAPEIEDLDL